MRQVRINLQVQIKTNMFDINSHICILSSLANFNQACSLNGILEDSAMRYVKLSMTMSVIDSLASLYKSKTRKLGQDREHATFLDKR